MTKNLDEPTKPRIYGHTIFGRHKRTGEPKAQVGSKWLLTSTWWVHHRVALSSVNLSAQAVDCGLGGKSKGQARTETVTAIWVQQAPKQIEKQNPPEISCTFLFFGVVIFLGLQYLPLICI